ncbi:hypothetical protein NEOLEDRAFT_1216034 [Neolentinus lepideus HHB14362 ss-1]|uniref:Fungal-type protein kinase domain-containing protein n=1 Tax=Neolentinus lepideus HHB14362 ss-1 TaxID=1314782 RepID=A0A165QVQ4_9AGAM|nr:hypothetical protein NEOLEDRAFT_1216034 [Neolentinus lepideus HHB14362 ss-1]
MNFAVDASWSMNFQGTSALLKEELFSKQIFNETSALKATHAEVLDKLNNIASHTSGLLLDENVSDEQLLDGGKAHQTQRVKQEKLMYPLLCEIFDYISSSEALDFLSHVQHCHINRDVHLQTDHLHPSLDPKVSPDLQILDSDLLKLDLRHWQDRIAWGEVKCLWSDGPAHTNEPSKPESVKMLIRQGAHYVQLHMSGQPFLLFSVSLLIYGTCFCIAVFDCDSVLISPISNIVKESGLKTLIKIIRKLTHVLMDVELGQDPTVTHLSMDATKELLGQAISCPSHIVPSFSPSDSHQWCTVGPQLLSSISLFGHGMMVSYICLHIPGDGVHSGSGELVRDTMILKTAWRSGQHDPESHIYETVWGHHLGLAQLLIGNNVSTGDHNTITYTSDLELLKGWLAALNAADPATAKVSCEGLLTDLEYAKTAHISTHQMQVQSVAPVKLDKQGTMQFMSWKLLHVVAGGKDSVEHTISCATIKGKDNDKDKEAWKQWFQNSLYPLSFTEAVGEEFEDEADIIFQHMSDPLITTIYVLCCQLELTKIYERDTKFLTSQLSIHAMWEAAAWSPGELMYDLIHGIVHPEIEALQSSTT